jgi:hypothetical protein
MVSADYDFSSKRRIHVTNSQVVGYLYIISDLLHRLLSSQWIVGGHDILRSWYFELFTNDKL